MSHAPDRQGGLQQADIAALTAHVHADASGSHSLISVRIWHLLQGLGAPSGGRAMAFGVDPQILLSSDPVRTEPRDADGFPVHSRWLGTVPTPGFDTDANTARDALPISRYPLNLETAPPFAVALASMPNNDIHLRSREARVMRHRSFHIQVTEALTGLAPGGHAVILANHSLLDFPDPQPWARMAQLADFLGAVRLPSHALRTAPACDAPVDAIVLRRRQGTHPDPGLRFPGVQWSPQNGLHETTHFIDHPDRVLGTRAIGTDNWRMPQLAVHDPDHTWPARLEHAFTQIAHQHDMRRPSAPGASPTSPAPMPRPSTPGLRLQHERPGPEL